MIYFSVNLLQISLILSNKSYHQKSPPENLSTDLYGLWCPWTVGPRQ